MRGKACLQGVQPELRCVSVGSAVKTLVAFYMT